MVSIRSICWHSTVLFFVWTPPVINCGNSKIGIMIGNVIARNCIFKK